MKDKSLPTFTEAEYREAAQEYLRKVRMEPVGEETRQARQREITLASLALVHAVRPDIQYFNELLVQYPVKRRQDPRQVVPDNMVVLHHEAIQAQGSFDVTLQPVAPFWVLDYACSSIRKDYDDNMDHYYYGLKVPYYLRFELDTLELALYRHKKSGFVDVKPNRAGRYALKELELEVALLDDWVRYWFRGELLPLPADLLQQVDEFRQRWQHEKRRADDQQRRADDLDKELVRLRALLER